MGSLSFLNISELSNSLRRKRSLLNFKEYYRRYRQADKINSFAFKDIEVLKNLLRVEKECFLIFTF